MSDRAATILGISVLLGCGAMAWSNWTIAEAHRQQVAESREQAIESRKQAKALAEMEDRRRSLAGPEQAGREQAGRYQLLMDAEGKPLYLLNTETGAVWKANLTFGSWESALNAVKQTGQ